MAPNLCLCVLLGLAFFLTADATIILPSPESIFLRLFSRDGSHIDENIRNVSLLVPLLDKNQTTVIYIHGYEENITTESVEIISKAYLRNTQQNILAVDYREIANLVYPITTALLNKVGKTLADGLNDMIDAGVDPKKIHLIGHSLGSHLAGFTGRNMKTPVSRITGLDPAGPLFYILTSRLKASDAEFVDVIHTDMSYYGIALFIGHVDFFPNFGHRPQPGCHISGPLLSQRDLCSHHRSYLFYAESVENPQAFIGVSCSHSMYYIVGVCNGNGTVPMGIATPSNTRGNVYLTTNVDSPYGRGLEGADFGD